MLGGVGDTAETETVPGYPFLGFTVQWGTQPGMIQCEQDWESPQGWGSPVGASSLVWES